MIGGAGGSEEHKSSLLTPDRCRYEMTIKMAIWRKTMMPTYSVADACNHFAEIVHDLKHVSQIEVTRRGRPVAILISVEEFEKSRSGNLDFADAYGAFRSTVDLTQAGIEPEIFEGLRDASPGGEMSWRPCATLSTPSHR
jgi:prevent-host-death family protein